MKIDLGGTESISTVDWYGRSSTVIFLRGCPLRCPYCHNHHLFAGHDIVPIEEVKERIKAATPFVSAAVFSGGEPLHQLKPLTELLRYAKNLGLRTGLHTNGYYPDRLCRLIEEDLVDLVSLDVKAPLNDPKLYEKASGTSGGISEKVWESVQVASMAPEYEYKTAVFRGLVWTEKHIRDIANALPGGTYVLRQGLPEKGWAEWLKGEKPITRDDLLVLAEAAREYHADVRIRTKEEGEERV